MPRARSRARLPVEMAWTGSAGPSMPMRMTEPLPNCFSIWSKATSSAFSRSTVPPRMPLLRAVSVAAITVPSQVGGPESFEPAAPYYEHLFDASAGQLAVGELRSQVYRPGSERREHPRNGAQANSSPRASSAYLRHVWGRNQGTPRDNSGFTRAVVLWQ